ncbi:MAG: helix-turn-helix domain-containing protein [Sulfitobacter sp.]|nr:helix-turn-helix domain-containing protein [Sulfitobacter sp.]
MARPVKGADLVDGLEGETEAKRRLKVILEQIGGELTVAEATAELGIGRSTFFELRQKVLRSALAGLEPQPRGRPPAVMQQETEEEELARLRKMYDDQLTELMIANVKEELRLVMPDVVIGTPEYEAEKKRQRNRRKRQQKKRR